MIVYDDDTVDLIRYDRFLDLHETVLVNYPVGLYDKSKNTVRQSFVNIKIIKSNLKQPILKGIKKYKYAMTIGPLIYNNGNIHNDFV